MNIDEQHVAASARWMSQLGKPLQIDDLPLNTPLPARVLDADGTLLLDAGAALDATRRAQLFHYFRPYGQYDVVKDPIGADPAAIISPYGKEFVDPSDANTGVVTGSIDLGMPADAPRPSTAAAAGDPAGHVIEPKGTAPAGSPSPIAAAGQGAAPRPEDEAPKVQIEVGEMGLSIGNRLGIRLPMGHGRTAYASRLIGMAPHGPLLVMPPTLNQARLALSVGETVEVVAVCPRSIYLFTCTVEWLATMPFQYVVLSAPARIRTLRERRAIRSTARLAVLYAASGRSGAASGSDAAEQGVVTPHAATPIETLSEAAPPLPPASVDAAGVSVDDGAVSGSIKPGLGVAIDISTGGMLLAADAPLGVVGDRLQILFYVEAEGVPIAVDVECDIRSITQRKPVRVPSGEWVHGLSFGPLPPTQRLVLKSYVLGRRIEHDRN